MSRTSRYMVRMVLAAMLFQFLSPAFIPLIVQEVPTEKATAYQPQHRSVLAPTLLKENDEKEDGDVYTPGEWATILDFTSHSFNLAVSHSNEYSKFEEEAVFMQPSRLTLFCALLI